MTGGRRARSVLALLALLLVAVQVTLLAPTEWAQAQEGGRYPPPDYPVPGGWFFSQESREPESVAYRRGYTVIDDGEAFFWTEFQRFGGVPILGYPVSRRYRYPDQFGLVHQAFQRGILQWHPETGRAEVANVFEQFTEQGLDEVLETAGVPMPRPSSQLPFAEDAERRMSWLTEPRFLARYLFDPVNQAPVEVQEAAWIFLGLPQDYPQRPVYLRERTTGRAGAPLYLPYTIQRFQKGALQLFLETFTFDPTVVPGDAKKGCVAMTAAGRLARRLGSGKIIPGAATLPEPLETPPQVHFLALVPPLGSAGQQTVDFEMIGTGFQPGEPVTIRLTPPAESFLPDVVRRVDATDPDGSFDIIMTARVSTYVISMTGELSGKRLNPNEVPSVNLAQPSGDILAGTQYPFC